jgi:hypothetical protein
MAEGYIGSTTKSAIYGRVYGTSGANSDTIIAKKYVFKEPHILWLVTHNLNTKNFKIGLQDSDGREFFAGVEALDNNQFLVRMTEPVSGTVNAIFFV